MAILLVLVALTNLVYQVIRKPTELFAFVGDALDKEPAETWRQYGPLFRAYSTSTITPELLAGLEARGARVTRVPVYQWTLPEDLGPLRDGIRAIAASDVDVVMFTTATQVNHLLQVAESMQMAEAVREKLARTVIASIGPTTSAELRERGIGIDLEPSHPKMGFLVRETAERAAEIVKTKRA